MSVEFWVDGWKWYSNFIIFLSKFIFRILSFFFIYFWFFSLFLGDLINLFLKIRHILSKLLLFFKLFLLSLHKLTDAKLDWIDTVGQSFLIGSIGQRFLQNHQGFVLLGSFSFANDNLSGAKAVSSLFIGFYGIIIFAFNLHDFLQFLD